MSATRTREPSEMTWVIAFHLIPVATALPMSSVSSMPSGSSRGTCGAGVAPEAIVPLTLAPADEPNRAHLRRRALRLDGADPRRARGARRAGDVLRHRPFRGVAPRARPAHRPRGARGRQPHLVSSEAR